MWFRENPEKSKDLNHDPKQKTQRYTSKKIISQEDLRKTIAVLTVPRSHDGQLVKKLRETENKLRAVSTTKVKINERVVTTMKTLLVKSNPWVGSNCPRFNYLPCRADGKKYDCRRRNLVYMSSCNLCKEQGGKACYLGETSNSLHERME